MRSVGRGTVALVTVTVVVAMLATAVVGTGRASNDASRQRVAVTMLLKQKQFPDWSGTFKLIALTPGALSVESGTIRSDSIGVPQSAMRDGQSFTADKGTDTLVGRRGTIVVGWTQTIVSAGTLYSIASGSWRIRSGTGAYARLQGSGRLAAVIGEASHVGHVRYEGYLTSP